MNLIIGVRFFANDPDRHKQIMRVNAHLMWEHFLSNLIYIHKIKKGSKFDIDVYVSQFKEGKKIFHLFEYIVPMTLIDYYGRKDFKSVLPQGSMVDLMSSHDAIKID